MEMIEIGDGRGDDGMEWNGGALILLGSWKGSREVGRLVVVVGAR